MKAIYFIHLIGIFCICLPLKVFADHTVGATLSYKHLGTNPNNQNEFKIDLAITSYIDCSLPFDGTIDGAAFITIYALEESSSTYTLFDELNVFRTSTDTLRNIEYECLAVPNNICTEVAIFSQELSLPYTNDTYLFIYNTCCRNAANVNIINPEDNGLILIETISNFEQINVVGKW